MKHSHLSFAMVLSQYKMHFVCLSLLFSFSQSAVFESKEKAHNLLKRYRRANSWFEEWKLGSLERECNEEICSFEEAREIFRDDERTMQFWTPYTDLNIALNCSYDNGRCEHFCVETELSARKCTCADGYALFEDDESCMPTREFPCGKIPILDKEKVATGPGKEGRIVGGTECPAGECPWQALLKNQDRDICGGVLITPTWVITAAHCLDNVIMKHLVVVLGEHNTNTFDGTEQKRNVVEIISHENYRQAQPNHDIALLKLEKPVNFTDYVVPICLPEWRFAVEILSSIKYSTVSGWGQLNEKGPVALVLQRIELPRIKTQECIEHSGMNVTENMFCAGYLEGIQDSCKGDSGGPHATKYKNTWFLTGLVSWGKGCANRGKYGVYTRVSRYLDWLKKHISA
ncbi:coagulation factor VII [Latimeria chalumnae]|uniref:coagulation factor VII n=1 Tax=Latimeria chalumnae TaxID=7897 RepID=UPI00313EE6E7